MSEISHKGVSIYTSREIILYLQIFLFRRHGQVQSGGISLRLSRGAAIVGGGYSILTGDLGKGGRGGGGRS